MVLGLRSKNRKGTSAQVDYLVHVQEIKPWPPSQSVKSVQSLLLQWENGDQSLGSLTAKVGDVNVEFSESFRLPVTLCRESSRKSTSRDSFQKNFLEFNLYEPRKDKAMKGTLLGSAIINLADHGIIKDTTAISTPINLKKSSKGMMQPVLFLNIQPFERDDSGLPKQASLDKDGSESVSEVTNEGNDEECEIASFTDDDIDDVSSHSSHTVPSLAVESSRSSPGQYNKNESGSGSANDVTRRVNEEPTLSSGVSPSNQEVYSAGNDIKHINGASSPSSTAFSSSLRNPVNDFVLQVAKPGESIQNDGKNYLGSEESQINQEATGKSWRHDESNLVHDMSTYFPVGPTEGKRKKEQQENGHDDELFETKTQSSDENLVGQLREDAMKTQSKLRSNTLAPNGAATGMQANSRREKLKHLKSVQLHFDSTESDGLIASGQLQKKANKIDALENIHKSGMSYTPSNKPETMNSFSSQEVKLKSKIEMPDKEFGKAKTATLNAPNSVVADQRNSANKVQVLEKARKTVLVENDHKADEIHGISERKDMKGSFEGSVDLKFKVDMLQEELTEAATLEVGLYSVAAEHGSSMNKVHAPARRLSRFYFHTCKAGSQAKRASAARAIISGLILVTKACGNNVPRLTFWLSNSIVLRAIVSHAARQSIDKTVGQKGSHKSSPYGGDRANKTESSDEWENLQTFMVALEKVEAWIFSRIVESVWWQTLTPHMQSTAVKGSSSRKTHARRYGLGDQEQGNFAIDLWKKAFKDACERLCPIRGGGHECGCLPLLSRLVMEQLVNRLDVAMFNAILRESPEDMPTDPVSDPISDPKVLPIPAGKLSFGAGAQLKNAVGNWCRWLTDIFGIDDCEPPVDGDECRGNKPACETSFKAFYLLNALSDLMMLPFEMLTDRSTRREVCPTFAASIIRRVLYNFVPDEFNPDPIPDSIFETLDSEDISEADIAKAGEECITSFPCIATPIIYSPPPATSLPNITGEVGNEALQRSGSTVLRKSYTSDDELDELDSPMTSIFVENSKSSSASKAPSWMQKGKGGRKVVRYQLLREVWKNDV